MLAVAVQAQFNFYGYGAAYPGLTGYYPYASAVAGIRATPYTAVYSAPAAIPAYYGYPSYSASQYHAQDELGQANFGYAHPGQAATNMRDAFGNQIGSYAYINPEGKEVRVSYTADHRGFRVLSNALPEAPVATLTAPVQVQDTPEVAQAKAEHLAAVTAAKSGVVPAVPVAPVAVAALPAPVQDTPEVAVAKAEFAAKFAAAKAAASAAPAVRRKRQVYGLAPFAGYNFGVSPYAYSVAAPAAYTVAAPVQPVQPVREATLTRTVLTPGHSVAYRVD